MRKAEYRPSLFAQEVLNEAKVKRNTAKDKHKRHVILALASPVIFIILAWLIYCLVMKTLLHIMLFGLIKLFFFFLVIVCEFCAVAYIYRNL
ncbi:hypothetical protein [uncultured Limosilactobacillus sp.]|uniref:hypothetical protein n=1 Tax=uncultured Limosilactobacillus sp. TaxID=2837629 RepID=UPI0025D7BCC4|nr:hypothetical protein [uncultured Limosilactobacillus sp.]